MTGALLRTQAPGVSPHVRGGAYKTTIVGDSYCIDDTEDAGASYYHYDGGASAGADAATITAGPCTAVTPT